jgi:hypothetical protein
MQMCSVDVTHIPDVTVGDEATIPVRRTLVSAHLPKTYQPFTAESAEDAEKGV